MIERLLAATAIDTLRDLMKKAKKQKAKRGAKPPVYSMRMMHSNLSKG
jgi:hypothetical protein